jgi:hypothetical protein
MQWRSVKMMSGDAGNFGLRISECALADETGLEILNHGFKFQSHFLEI